MKGRSASSWMPSDTTGSSTMQLAPRADPDGDDPVGESACYRHCCSNMCLTLWAVWCGIILLAVAMVLCVELALFHKETFETSPYDVHVVTHPGFGVFCREAVFFHPDHNYKVTLFPDFPRLNKSYITHHVTKVSQELEPDGSEYWGFYLLEGSVVKVSPSSNDTGFHQRLLNGKTTLQNWLNTGDGDSIDHVYITSSDQTFTYAINQTDDYYFYYTANCTDRNTTIDVKFDLARTNYDYSDSLETTQCSDNVSCYVPVPFDAKPRLVFRANDEIEFRTCLTVECELGLPLFLLVILLGFVISVVIVFAKCMCKRSMANQDGEKAMLNHGAEPIYVVNVNHV